jgi:hypothetical protein
MSKNSRTPRDRTAHQEQRPTRPLGPLPYLTVIQGLRLRDLARKAFVEEGVEVVAHEDYLEDEIGRRFGLTNLAAECRKAPYSAWPAIVTWHVRGVLEAGTDPFLLDTMSAEEILSRTFLRVVGTRAIGEVSTWFDYPRLLCADLLELMVLRSSGSVRYLRDADVERVGFDALRAAGLENLLRDPLGRHSTRVVDGARLHFVDGDSVHTASKLLIFEDVLRRTVGTTDHPDGLLVAAPNRYELVFYPVDEHLVTATAVLARYAYRSCLGESGPVSPNVYWWRDGDLSLVSQASGPSTSRPQIHPYDP